MRVWGQQAQQSLTVSALQRDAKGFGVRAVQALLADKAQPDRLGLLEYLVNPAALRDSGSLNFSRPFISAFLLEFLCRSLVCLASS